MRRPMVVSAAVILGLVALGAPEADAASLPFAKRPVKEREASRAKASLGVTPTPADLLGEVQKLAGVVTIATDCAMASDKAAAPAKGSCESAKKWIDGEVTDGKASRVAGADSLQQALLEARQRVTLLKKWVGEFEKRCRAAGSPPECDVMGELRTRVDNVRTELSKGMVAEGLRETLTAELVTGALFGRAQGEPSGSTQANSPVYLQIKSRPFGPGYDQDRDLEFRLGVRFGLVPTLSLVKPAPQPSPSPSPTTTTPKATRTGTGGTTGDTPAATDTLNTVFEVRADMARALGDASDLGVTVAGGQIWSNTDQVQRKLDGKDTLFVTLPGAKGRDALFFEAGLRFRYFDDIPRDARAEQPSVEPRIELSAVYRHDPRLNVQAGTLGFDSPEDRLVAKLMLSGIPVLGRKNADGKPVHIGIGVEHERGFGHNPAPSVTRVFLRGDVDLLKSLSGTK